MNNEKEISEAIVAGERLLDEIENILSDLKKASVWGIVDLVSDSGLLTSILKHSSLNKAQERKERLPYLIERFNDELADVRLVSNIDDIAMSDGIKFCDFFLDGILIDALTLSRITESKKQMQELKENVIEILNDLNQLKEMEDEYSC